MEFYNEYLTYCEIPADINEHLPALYNLACDPDITNIVEFGVGPGRSTRAFIAALEQHGGRLDSYDIQVNEGVSDLFERAHTAHLHATLHIQSTLEAKIDFIDLLLVDSHHTYDQVKSELAIHGNNVSKYICFHDTQLYGINGQDPGSNGILQAITEWMNMNQDWKIKDHYLNNNGLLILERN